MNLFHTKVSFLYLLKTSENQRYRNGTLAWKGLIYCFLLPRLTYFKTLLVRNRKFTQELGDHGSHWIFKYYINRLRGIIENCFSYHWKQYVAIVGLVKKFVQLLGKILIIDCYTDVSFAIVLYQAFVMG